MDFGLDGPGRIDFTQVPHAVDTMISPLLISGARPKRQPRNPFNSVLS